MLVNDALNNRALVLICGWVRVEGSDLEPVIHFKAIYSVQCNSAVFLRAYASRHFTYIGITFLVSLV